MPSVHSQLNDQTVLFLKSQFSISHLFALRFNEKKSSIWAIDGTLSVTTTPRQSNPESNDYEVVLCIPQSSQSDC